VGVSQFKSQDLTPRPPGRRRVVVLDCGVKYNILRNLEARGCQVIVLPAAATAAEILGLSPQGVLLSNGPGDPAALPYIVETVRSLLGKLPIFGICLGHQILGQAVGGRTEKLKFGHHGINQPVRSCQSGRVEITSQKPRVRGRPRVAPGGAGDDPRQPQRLHLRGAPLPETQGLQRPAPPRGGAGTSRGGTPLRRVSSCSWDEGRMVG